MVLVDSGAPERRYRFWDRVDLTVPRTILTAGGFHLGDTTEGYLEAFATDHDDPLLDRIGSRIV